MKEVYCRARNYKGVNRGEAAWALNLKRKIRMEAVTAQVEML